MKIKFLIFLGAWIIGLPACSQKLEGIYIAQNSIWSGELTLSETYRFKMASGLNMGHATTLSMGYYLKEKDTLVLCFERYTDPSPSTYSIKSLSHEKVKDGKHKMISIIQIEDKDSIPLGGVSVTFKNKFTDDYLTLISDKEGKIENVVMAGVESIHFQMLGYKSLTLEVTSLESSLSSVRIILKPFESVEYDNVPRIGKYLIKANKRSIELHGIDTSNETIYVLKKRSR